MHMWLILDTTKPGVVQLYYSRGESWQTSTTSVDDSFGVLECVHQLLSHEGTSIQSLRGVGIVQSRGAFTATRVAATIANVLSLALQIPAIGVQAQPAKHPEKLFGGLTGQHFVLPEYSGEPTIGRKKD